MDETVRISIDQRTIVDRTPLVEPLIGNLVTAHVWTEDDAPKRCLRCGVGYPNTESCP